MSPRIVRVVVALALTAVLGACAPQPHPSPSASSSSSPTFSTEAEAFAAAERTYRAYVDALNEVDLSDPDTFEPVFALTTGDANAGERESLRRMYRDRWTVSGEARVISVTKGSSSADAIELLACTDVSAVLVTDSAGRSQVSDARPDRQSVRVVLKPSGSSAYGLLIEILDGGEHPCG